MSFDPRRHSRQVRLVDVGEAGQVRLGGGTVTVGGRGTLGAEVEARYLAGAGVGRLVVADEALARAARAVDPAAEVRVDPAVAGATGLPGDPRGTTEGPSFDVGDPAVRDIAEGAWRALRAVRAAFLGKD